MNTVLGGYRFWGHNILIPIWIFRAGFQIH